MNSIFRRIALAVTVILAVYVGAWAEFFPASFYASFPGFGMHLIDVDGPYNQHLVRDVGSLYLALGAASVFGIVSRSAVPGRVAGLAWSVFGILHFGYHLTYPEGTMLDRVGTIVSLGLSLALGLVLLLPTRSARAEPGVAQ
jgi:hypothetical protein